MPYALSARRALALLAVFTLPAAPAFAGGVRSCDRVLLLSTRPIGCSTSGVKLATKAYAAECVGGRWDRNDPNALLGSIDPSRPLIVFVHGNRISASDARSRGMHVYRRFARCATEEQPLQFLIFTWCSDKIPGQLRDYREKAARTRPVAAQLAWTIDQTPPGTPIGLFCYSYGSRVASGAAHLLAGGCLPGITRGAAEHRPMRAVFLSAAMDACWLARGNRHGHAMDRIDSLLVTTNPNDLAMKFYRIAEKNYDPHALGESGPRGLDAATAARVCTINVSGAVGRSHDLYRYLNAPGVMRSAWRRLAFTDLDAASGTPTLANR